MKPEKQDRSTHQSAFYKQKHRVQTSMNACYCATLPEVETSTFRDNRETEANSESRTPKSTEVDNDASVEGNARQGLCDRLPLPRRSWNVFFRVVAFVIVIRFRYFCI
jgi:hypothetical protein